MKVNRARHFSRCDPSTHSGSNGSKPGEALNPAGTISKSNPAAKPRLACLPAPYHVGSGPAAGMAYRAKQRPIISTGVKVVFFFLLFSLMMNGTLTAGEPVASEPVITIAAVGDIMMGTDYPLPELPKKDGSDLFIEATGILKRADVIFGNLEGVLYDEGSPAKTKEGSYAFRTPTKFVKNLVNSGFNVLSLANNHAWDFGYEGMSSTKRTLKRAGIKYSSKAGEIAEFEINGLKIGLVAFSFGSPPRSVVHPDSALGEIGSLSVNYDIFIVSVHGGSEGAHALHVKNESEFFVNEPRGNLVEFAHAAVERGADLILAHGPHVPRAMEVYKKKLIAYSLGNFCTYGGMSLSREMGYAPILWVELNKNGDFIRGRIYSFVQARRGGPRRDEEERAWNLIRKLSQEDFPETSPLFTMQEIVPRKNKAR